MTSPTVTDQHQQRIKGLYICSIAHARFPCGLANPAVIDFQTMGATKRSFPVTVFRRKGFPAFLAYPGFWIVRIHRILASFSTRLLGSAIIPAVNLAWLDVLAAYDAHGHNGDLNPSCRTTTTRRCRCQTTFERMSALCTRQQVPDFSPPLESAFTRAKRCAIHMFWSIPFPAVIARLLRSCHISQIAFTAAVGIARLVRLELSPASLTITNGRHHPPCAVILL